MSQRKSKTVEKALTYFLVSLAVLSAFFAVVQAIQLLDGRGRTAETTLTETAAQTETVAAVSTSTTKATTATTTTATTTTTTTTTKTTTQPDTGEKVVYLTFDDGPTSNTDNIMNVLEENGVRATFFVIHTYDGCENQIRSIHERGHCVALHTYSHNYGIYRSQEKYFEDLDKISDLVYNATGVRSKLVRFPGGSSNTVSRSYKKGIMTELTQELTKRGYVYFDWNVDSSDASAGRVPADKIVRNSTSAIGKMNKVIILMHDAQAKTTTVDALPEIITAYRNAGYRFDVLSENSFTWHHSVLN